jgi:4-amino-4-deoxy-L-arabinose transferase-like glycosyltransferase
MQQPPGVRSHVTRVVVLVVLFSAFTVVLKLPSLGFTHDEPDEVVYWSLARNLLERGAYTVRGTEILNRLSPAIYDRPLFHHPPLYPILLTPFVALQAEPAAVTISWFGHLLCLVSVGIIGWTLLVRGEGSEDVLWLALLGVATDPLLALVSRKLWIDALLAGLVAFALALVWAALISRRRRLLLILGGVVLGLAALTKLPGLIGAPVAAMLVWTGGGTRRERVRDLLLVAAPCALLVLPWIVVFLATYGTLTPTWLTRDEWAIKHYPFLAAAVGRPWYYYAAKLAIGEPVALLGLAFLLRRPRALTPASLVAPAWLFLWLIVYTVQSAGGYGFLMRYVAPIVPAIYAMLLYVRHPGPFGRQVIALAIAYGAIESTVYLLSEHFDELVSFPELAKLVRF